MTAPPAHPNCRCTPRPAVNTADPQAPFLAAIFAAPDDDLPRVVYADWLEEKNTPDDVALARYIREQCERPEWTFCFPDQPAVLVTMTPLEYPTAAPALAPAPAIVGVIDTGTARVETRHPPPGCSYILHRGFVAGLRVRDVATWVGDLCRSCDGYGWIDRLPDPNHPYLSPVDPRDEPRYECGRLCYPCRMCSARGYTGGVGWRMVSEFPLLERIDTDRTPAPYPGNVALADNTFAWFRATTSEERSGAIGYQRASLPAGVFARLPVEGQVYVMDEVFRLVRGDAPPPGWPPNANKMYRDRTLTLAHDTPPVRAVSEALIAFARWQNTPFHRRSPKEFFTPSTEYR